MKVENNGLNRLNRPETESSHAVERTGRSGEALGGADSLGGKDKATLSEQARLLARARTSLEDTPEVRQAKVDELKAQVSSGTYKVPHEALVKKLLAQVRLGE